MRSREKKSAPTMSGSRPVGGRFLDGFRTVSGLCQFEVRKSSTHGTRGGRFPDVVYEVTRFVSCRRCSCEFTAATKGGADARCGWHRSARSFYRRRRSGCARFFRFLEGENCLRRGRVAEMEKNLEEGDRGGRREIEARFLSILEGGKCLRRERVARNR